MTIDEEQLKKLYKDGLILNSIATRLGCSRSTVVKYIKKMKDSGELANRIEPKKTIRSYSF